MASLETLPSDQRAVLELVLRSGRSYDEIAATLKVDRAGVRERALSALDTLGPTTDNAPERRALITDYLLGQLPPRVADSVRDRLAESASERAWARVLASELAPIAAGPLPEIPPAAGVAEPKAVAVDAAEPTPAAVGTAEPNAVAAPGPARSSTPDGAAHRQRPSSRRGGALLLGLGAAVVVAVVLIFVFAGGSGGTHSSSSTTSSSAAATTTAGASAGSTTTATSAGSTSGATTASQSTTSTTTRTPPPIAHATLAPPKGGSTAKGLAEVFRQGNRTTLGIVATGVAANNHNAYAVWLYNSPTDAKRLGFVSQAVGTDGLLQAQTQSVPADFRRYKQLVISLETDDPRTPTKVVLAGTLVAG